MKKRVQKKRKKGNIRYMGMFAIMTILMCMMSACGDVSTANQTGNEDSSEQAAGDWWDALSLPKLGGSGSGNDLIGCIGQDLESTLEELETDDPEISQFCSMNDENGDGLIDMITLVLTDSKYTLAGVSIGMTKKAACSVMGRKYTESGDMQGDGVTMYVDDNTGNMIGLSFEEDGISQKVIGVAFYSSEAINSQMDGYGDEYYEEDEYGDEYEYEDEDSYDYDYLYDYYD